MKRQVALLRFAWGSGRRRAGRTFAILFALALVSFAYASVLFLTEALRQEYRAAAAALPDLTLQRLVAGRPGLISETKVSAIRQIPGVTEVRPRVWGYYFVPAMSGNFTVIGVDPTGEEREHDQALVISQGRPLKPGASGEVVLGEALATFLGLEVGDAVTLPVEATTKRLEVVGLFRSNVSLWTADVLLMSVADAREFLPVPPGWATDVAVYLSTPDETVVAARKIAELFPGIRILDRELMKRTYDLTFDTRGGMMGAMLLPALIAFLILAWDRLTGVGPVERREVGVLKALGWRTSDILLARLWENTLVGVHGALLGILAAYFYVFHTRAPGLADILLGWSALYPSLDLAPAVDTGQVFTLLCLVVVPYVAAGLVPAWTVAVRDPHELLRGTS